jgi:uncharacterized membrane protein YgcG
MRGFYLKATGALGALILAGGIVGCSSLSNNNGHVDCNVVKLQSQAGRSNNEIASALGVSESDVSSCHPPGAMPSTPEMGGAPEAAPEGSASPSESSSGESSSGGGSSGESSSGGSGGGSDSGGSQKW